MHGAQADRGEMITTSVWQETEVTLTVRLGEVKLLAFHYPFLQHTAHFTDLHGDPDVLAGTAGPLPGGVAGRIIRSHPIAARLPTVARIPGALRYAPMQYERYFTDLRGTFTEYLGQFSSKTRATLRKKIRRFEEAHGAPVKWRAYRGPEEIEAFHGLARAISRRTYQERLLDAGLPADAGFLQGAKEAAARDDVRAFLLFHDDRPVAYLYCPARNGVLTYEHLGYDPDYRQWSPGTILQYFAFESLFGESRWRLFDFTEGEGEHKRLFATGSMFCADIYYFRPTLRNASAVRLHAAASTSSDMVGAALDRVGLKRRLKQALRRWASSSTRERPGE